MSEIVITPSEMPIADTEPPPVLLLEDKKPGIPLGMPYYAPSEIRKMMEDQPQPDNRQQFINMFDGFTGLGSEVKLSAATKERIALGLKKLNLNERLTSIEIFLCESPLNNYQPQPPTGWTAFRSNKRRVFVKNDESGRVQFSSPVADLVKRGLAVELPL